MNDYNILYNNPELNSIIDSINEINTDYWLCHGRYHTMFVIEIVEYILTALGYDSRTVELGKIAALLHDIGNIRGREHHAHSSAEMCAEFLDKISLTRKEKKLIIKSIDGHSDIDRTNIPIGAALPLADKMDISKNRVLLRDFNDELHANFKEINYVGINIANGVATICYNVTGAFDINLFTRKLPKVVLLPAKAVEYLGCRCRYQVNGVDTDMVSLCST